MKKNSHHLKEKVRIALRLDRAVKLVWKITPGWTLVNAALVAIQGVLPLVTLFLIKKIVDSVTAGLTAADKTQAFRAVLIWVLLAGAAELLRSLTQALSGLSREAQSLLVADAVSDRIHEKSIAMDLAYYEDSDYYDTLHRAQQEAPNRPIQIVRGLIQVAQSFLSLAGIMVLLFAFNSWIGIILVIAVLPGTLVKLKFSRKLYNFQIEQTERERRSWYFHFIITSLNFAKEVRLFSLGKVFRQRFMGLRKEIRTGKIALSRSRALLDLAAQSVSALAIFGTFGYIAWQAVAGAITLGSLVMYYQGFQKGVGFLQSLLGGIAGLYENNLFLSHFYRFLELEPKISAPAESRQIPDQEPVQLDVDGLVFAYPSSRKKVLRGISMSIRPGETVALVGENGSGKTTLIKLLCRLYDPLEGSIRINGNDLRSFDPDEWRQRISVTFQDFMKYQLSGRENIWLGNVTRPADDRGIENAARFSGADTVLGKLPDGFDSPLGLRFHGGHELSGGEWQKVALARTFFRDAQLVVLDEPTSSLDPVAEAELFAHFKNVMAGKSGILISHRFSTVKMADRIFVIDKGKILESGSHAELMRMNGLYAKLYRIQAANYFNENSC